MRSLTVKLTLASLCSSIVSVVLVGLFAGYQTNLAFSRYVQDRRLDAALERITAYYAQHSSWVGVDALLHAGMSRAPGGNPPQSFRDPPPLDGRPGGPPPPDGRPGGLPPPGGPPPPPYVVADMQGIAVTNGPGYTIGMPIPAALIAQGTPIEVASRRVGTIVALSKTATLDEREQAFVTSTNHLLIIAIVGGSVSALIICIVLTQLLTRPIRALTIAIRAMHRGTLRQQVNVTSRDEMGELGKTFNQMSDALARAIQSRRQMTADIAHELRTPLSVLLGYIETMRDGLLPPTHERFQAMFVEANQLQRLIDDLRVLSLADAGELSLFPQQTNPDDVLQTVTTAFARQAAQQSVALRIDSRAGLPLILVDQERLIQVLGNIVSNALRYTPAGGTITLSAAYEHGQIQLEVRDTGCGIAPEQLPSIFERLYRADPSRAATGSGLGLAIAKAIVDAHGGTITAGSSVGVGTQIKISLPSNPCRATGVSTTATGVASAQI